MADTHHADCLLDLGFQAVARIRQSRVNVGGTPGGVVNIHHLQKEGREGREGREGEGGKEGEEGGEREGGTVNNEPPLTNSVPLLKCGFRNW